VMPKNKIAPGQSLPLPVRLQWTGVFILIAGLIGAASICLTASDERGGAIGYESVGGNSYAIMPGDTKSYQYDLGRIGGTSAVLAAELNDWFSGLWHGRQLGCTLAFLSVGTALACFVLAHLLGHGVAR